MYGLYWGYIRVILGLCRDGLYWDIGAIMGLYREYRDNGQENENYYIL